MSFLTRIAKLPPENPLDAITRNLSCVLNAPKGFASPDPNFGIGKFHESLADSDSLAALEDEIVEQIKYYEPRLADIHLEFIGRGGKSWIYFILQANRLGQAAVFRIRMHAHHHSFQVHAGKGCPWDFPNN